MNKITNKKLKFAEQSQFNVDKIRFSLIVKIQFRFYFILFQNGFRFDYEKKKTLIEKLYRIKNVIHYLIFQEKDRGNY